MLLVSALARREHAERWEGFEERGDDVGHGDVRVCGLEEENDEGDEICDERVLAFQVEKKGAVRENTIFVDGRDTV